MENAQTSRPPSIYTERLLLVLIGLALMALTILELTTALHLEVARSLTRKALWAGALLWTLIVVSVWKTKLKEVKDASGRYTRWVMVFLLTTLGGISLVALRVETLFGFSVWSNTVLWLLFLGVFLLSLPQAWKNPSA